MLKSAWSTTKTVSLLGLLAVFAALPIKLAATGRAETIRRPLGLAVASAAEDAMEFAALRPHAKSPVERLADPMIELEHAQPRRKATGLQVASLPSETTPTPGGNVDASLPETAVRWTASPSCLNDTLRKIVGEVAMGFGPVTVNSTCRSRSHNAKVGGARHSQHLTGDAVDFDIDGDVRTVLAFLKHHRGVGGLKHYSDGHFHIDTGRRRTW
jgi:hypothetical protein